jgi:hypothetical protein
VFEAESRLSVVREIHRNPEPWMRWLDVSRVWRRSCDEPNCPPPEVLLWRIDASAIDGDSSWAFRIHEIKAIETLEADGW